MENVEDEDLIPKDEEPEGSGAITYKSKLDFYYKLLRGAEDDDIKGEFVGTSILGDFAFHAAIRAGHCEKFLEKIVEKCSECIEQADEFGSTTLHQAAVSGNLGAARLLVRKRPSMTQTKNCFQETPLHMAAKYAHKATVLYLLSVTKPVANDNPYDVKLLNYLIVAGWNDIALDILHDYPNLAIEKDRNELGNEGEKSALETLAEKSRSFESGSQIEHGRWLQMYNFVADIYGYKKEAHQTIKGDGRIQKHENAQMDEPAKKPYNLLSKARDIVLNHMYAIELANRLVTEIISRSKSEYDVADLLVPPLISATKLGIYELVTVIIKHCPPLILLHIDDEGRSIFHLSVIHRQEKVFNLLYQMSTQKHIVTAAADKKGRNLLHMAAMLGPVEKATGAALQMQREMQWFKEVEKWVQPSYHERRITTEQRKLSLKDVEVIVKPKSDEEILSSGEEEKTPRMLFTETHNDLVKEGERWIKETVNSHAVVAALVLTLMFTAAITAPGGNDENGLPKFLTEKAFLIFAVSNGIALVSSTTSLIMFLGILTSRYQEEDFLWKLPTSLCFALFTLFVSMAAMLVAFCATFYIVLYHKVSWAVALIGLIAAVPLSSFVFLQFPLFLEIIESTFLRGMFYKQSPEIII